MFFSFLRCSSRGNGRRQRDISPSDVVSRGSRFRNSRGRSSLTCGTVQSFPVPSSRRSCRRAVPEWRCVSWPWSARRAPRNARPADRREQLLAWFISFELSSSLCGVSAIDSERVTDHEAFSRAAKPKNCSGDLLRPTKPPDRLISQHVFYGDRFLGHHVRNHWRLDGSRAHCIDANPSGGILERSTPGQPDHSMLGCMVYCSAREADQAANGRAVDDGTASLLTHLAQLVLHAVPDAAEIDRVNAINLRRWHQWFQRQETARQRYCTPHPGDRRWRPSARSLLRLRPRQQHCSGRQSLYGRRRPVLLLQSEPHSRRCLLAPLRLPLPRRLWPLPDPCQSPHR